jgi:thymidine kinase
MEKMENKMERKGILNVILSSMFGGKTSHLMRIIEILGRCSRVLYVNHIFDIRSANGYSTHSLSLDTNLEKKLNVDMKKVANLSDIDTTEYARYDVICIDEGQFFPDLVAGVINLVDIMGKEVYVAGLSGSFERRKFGYILDLIPLADDVKMLRDTLCSVCAKKGEREKALFSFRTSKSSAQILIGDEYLPVCRKCYLLNINL